MVQHCLNKNLSPLWILRLIQPKSNPYTYSRFKLRWLYRCSRLTLPSFFTMHIMRVLLCLGLTKIFILKKSSFSCKLKELFYFLFSFEFSCFIALNFLLNFIFSSFFNNRSARLRANLRFLPWIKAIQWFLVVIPVLVLFYQSKGLTLFEVTLLQALYSGVVLVLEIPSGYFADLFGRKRSLIIGSFFCLGGAVLYCFAQDFLGFLAAEIFFGFAMAFISGADSALTYDTLHELEQSHEYVRTQGRIDSYDNFSEGIASILGGFLAVVSMALPFYVRAVVSIFMIPLAFLIIEPKVFKKTREVSHAKNLWNTIHFSFFEQKDVRWLLLYSAFLGAATQTVVWFIQPYWKQLGMPLIWFGIMWAFLQFITGIFSIVVHRLEQRFGIRRLFFGLVALLFFASISIGIGFPLFVSRSYFLNDIFNVVLPVFIITILFALFYIIRGLNKPLVKAALNHKISSERRATLLSIDSLLGRLFYILVGPLAGYVADVSTLSQGILFEGLVFTTLGILALFFLCHHGILRSGKIQ